MRISFSPFRLPAILAALFPALLPLPIRAESFADLEQECIRRALQRYAGRQAVEEEDAQPVIRAMAAGNVDALVEQALKSADKGSVDGVLAKSQFNWFMRLAGKIAPTIAFPVAGVKAVSDLSHYGMNYWRDWAANNRVAEFYERVIVGNNTVADLEKAWAAFENDYINLLYTADKGLSQVDMNAVIQTMRDGYAERRRQLAEQEERARAARARQEAQERIKKELGNIPLRARQDVAGARNYLKTTGQPETVENARRFLFDNGYQTRVMKTFWDNYDAGMAAKFPAEDNALAKSLQVAAEARQKAQSGPPDYGRVVQEIGLNADRLLTNNVSADEYARGREYLHAAAGEVHEACLGRCAPLWEQPEKRNCEKSCAQAHETFLKQENEVNLRVAQRLEDLKKAAQETRMGGFYGRDGGPLTKRYKELLAEFQAYPHGKSVKTLLSAGEDALRGWRDLPRLADSPHKRADITVPYLDEMEERLKRQRGYVAALDQLLSAAYDRQGPFRSAVEEFEKEFERQSRRHGDLFRENESLAGWGKLARYDFSSQSDEIAAARAWLDTDGFLSPLKINEMHFARGALYRDAEAWEKIIAENKAALSPFQALPKRLESLVTAPGLFLDRKNGQDYFDKNLKADVLFVRDALVRLAVPDSEPVPPPALPAGGRAGLAGHRARLAAFRGKLPAVQAIDLDGRNKEIYELKWAVRKAYDALPTPCGEMKELLKDSEATYVQLHRVDNGVDVAPEVTLSHGRLSQNADAYEAVLARAEEIERNVQGICEEHGGKPRPGERAAPEVDAFFAAGRWVPSAAVGKACGVRQNFVSGEDILDQRLNEPFNRVEINGKERTKDAQGVVRLLHTEVLNNELKVMGTLHPETVTRYKAVRVSLDRGHRFALAEFQSGQFFFVHPMAEATTGDLVVQAERDDGFLASFPAAGQSLPFRIDRDERALVRRLYEDFREAYEARNESGVMACLGDDWAADDGTTLQDLEDNLRRTFRAFDEVRCDLKVKDIAVDGGGRYRVSYDIILASRQFQRGLKHEEKSNVEEEVTVSPRGAPKITRTLSGRFWYIK